MPHVQSNGIQIYYEIHGNGDPLILISGLGGDRTFWQDSLKYFSAHYQVIIFDTRGIGRTEAPGQAYSMDMFADDLNGLMEGLNIPQSHILGFSMGGNIALQFAVNYPDKVRKLIIAASCATLNTQIRLYVDAVLDVYEKGITTKQMFDLIAPWLFSNNFLSNPENEIFLRFDENDPEQQPLYAWRNQYFAQRSFNIIPELEKITAKPLIITGEHDVFAQLADAKIIADGIPGSTLQVIPNVGHLFNYESPETFHTIVLDYLK